MSRLAMCLTNDVRLQLRQGFYVAYAVVTAIYVAILWIIPEEARGLFLPFLIFSDPAVAGFFFIGALLVLERDDRTLQTLFVTPLSPREYLLSKILSLTIMGTVTSLVISLAVRGLDFRVWLLIPGVALTSILFVSMGIAISTRFRVLNRYLVIAGLGIGFVCVPVLSLFGFVDSPLFYLWPTQASLILIQGSFSDQLPPLWALGYAFGALLLWIGAAWWWATTWFDRHVVQSVGGGS